MVQRGFVRHRKIRAHDKQFRNQLGYKHHALRNKDLMLTEVGRQTAEAIAAERKRTEPAAPEVTSAPAASAPRSQPPAQPETPAQAAQSQPKPPPARTAAKPAAGQKAGFYDYVLRIQVDE